MTDVVATLKARIEQLEAELAAEQQRSAGHRAHYDHERERADLLARSHENLDIQLKNLRLHLQAGRQAAAPRTLRDWWRCCARPADEIFLNSQHLDHSSAATSAALWLRMN
jgi:hypothetical protein